MAVPVADVTTQVPTYQVWFNILISIIGVGIGFWLKTIWDTIKEQRAEHNALDKRFTDQNQETLKYIAEMQLQQSKMHQELIQQITDVRLVISDNYVREPKYRQDMDKIFTELRTSNKEMAAISQILKGLTRD